MCEHKITVKAYMTKKATPEFDFMQRWNNNNPMPLRTMVGVKEKETRGMVYMKLHADITEKITHTCMKCGRPITNPVSQYFGMGPECGGHNYVNPFNSEAELQNAVEEYRKQLRKITWEGWIIKSAIETDVALGEESVETKTINVLLSFQDSQELDDEQSLFVSFDYSENLIALIKSFGIRYYHANNYSWEIPTSRFNALNNWLKDSSQHPDAIYDVKIKGQIKQKKPVCIAPDYKFKTKPFDHQIDGFNFGMEHNRWLLADEQGLGKTKQVIDIACAYKSGKGFKHCLIICGVNGLKWNWLNEISTHSNEKARILGMRKNGTIGGNADKLNDLKNIESVSEYFLITNVESLRENAISAEIEKLCKNGTIGIVAIDEIHKCKNPSSQQGKGILKVKPEVRIAMTGTPMMNAPLDLYIVLRWLGYEEHSMYAFKNHFCTMGGFGGYEIVGYKNLDELQERLKTIMLRRLKSEVFDLPDKLFVDEFVEMTAKQAVIYKEVTNEIKSNIDQIKMANNPLAELIRMRQATGYTGILSSTIAESAKLDRMEELVEEAVSNNKKAVVFSNWTQMTDEIFKRLSKYSPAIITGETKDEERQVMVNKFQNNERCKVIVGTIGAMGTGLTLTAGTVEIFLDEPWNRALKDQAVDRCHRIGTTENVTIYTIMCKNTIDERIHAIVEQKGAMSDAIVDGKFVGNKQELLNYLIG